MASTCTLIFENRYVSLKSEVFQTLPDAVHLCSVRMPL